MELKNTKAVAVSPGGIGNRVLASKVEVEGLEKVKLKWLDDDGPPSQ